MDNIPIAEEREAPPGWAVQTPTDDSPDAWTDRQKLFIMALIDERSASHLGNQQVAWIAEVRGGKRQLTKRAASELIEKLRTFPRRPRDIGDLPTNYHAERFAVGVPAGRYAVDNAQGELRFYKVWVSRDGKRLNVYVEHGPAESDLGHQRTVLSILNKIKTAGIRACAIRYGMEIGHCSNCGYRLTNRLSRELGIGPICGGRMFGDDGWKGEVKTARAAIRARGEDPNEEVQ